MLVLGLVNSFLVAFKLMELRLYEGGKKDIHFWVFFGFGRMSKFERRESDFLMTLDIGVGVHTTIMITLLLKSQGLFKMIYKHP